MKKEIQERVKFTNAKIEKLPRGNRKYYKLDSEIVGLRVVVHITGAKAFYLSRYIKQFGYSKTTKLGDFPEISVAEARNLAANIKADNVKGVDPIIAAQKRAQEKTLGDVLIEFTAKKLNHRSSSRSRDNIRDEHYHIGAWLWGNSNDPKKIKLWQHHRKDLNIVKKQLSHINQEDIFDYHGAISILTKYSANRMVRLVRKYFNYAKRKGYFAGDNPASMPKKDLNEELKDHLDYYSTVSMKKLIAAAEKLSKQKEKRVGCLAIMASLYCGGRPQSEVFNLAVDQIDLDKKLIHYKKSKVGQWSRPINGKMVKHLKMILGKRSNADVALYYGTNDLRNKYLFPNSRYGQTRRTKKGLRACKLKHIFDVRKLWKEIIKSAGVETRDIKSLRHTFAVFSISCGVSIRALQRMLGHASVQTTEIYAATSKEFLLAESEKLTLGFEAVA